MEDESELWAEFLQEAKSHIEVIENGLLQIEAGEEDDSVINSIFRAAHSIKGTASFFGRENIVELAHAIENLFDGLREHLFTVTPAMTDALLAAADLLKSIIHETEGSKEYNVSELVAGLRCFLRQAVQEERSLAKEKLVPAGKQAVTEMALASALSRQELSQQVREDEMKRHKKVSEMFTRESIRINVGLLNDLLDLGGEMVLWRNRLLRLLKQPKQAKLDVDAVSTAIDETTTKLQKKIMQTRMQPIAALFNRFPRVVRDIARKMGKEVDLVIQGMQVEMDRSLLEALIDPLTHLVRNAIDHGIEFPQLRRARNKAAAGSLVLWAYYQGGRVVVEVADDGDGIDLGTVRTKLVQKALMSDKEVQLLPEQELFEILMSPGFSTREEITEISGRGVGLDVVKTNVEKIGGKVEILSEKGKGTTFRLLLPLTLAIISVLLIKEKGQYFAVPQANLRELVLIRVDGQGTNRVENLHNKPVLRLRGELLPLVRLQDVLHKSVGTVEANWLQQDSNCLNQQERLMSEEWEMYRILVVRSAKRAFGILVEAVEDTEEILVKPLSTFLAACDLYSGVTVLGDGSIAMIVDTEGIRRKAGIMPIRRQVDTVLPGKEISEEERYLLLFRAAGGEVLGLDLGLVSRVETVLQTQIKRIGAKQYVFLQGQTIRIIYPEHYLPIKHKRIEQEKIYIILSKMKKCALGIAAAEIYDTVQTTVELDKGGVSGRGVLGSAMINDLLVILPDMHALFMLAEPEYYQRFSLVQGTDGGGAKGRGAKDKKKVLLVEDTPFFLKLVTSYLQSAGYEVLTATNGQEALKSLHEVNFAAVISDIIMPVMDGIELVQAIRADEQLRHLPVLALTSRTGAENREKGLQAGFDLYEYKLDQVSLLASLRQILRQK